MDQEEEPEVEMKEVQERTRFLALAKPGTGSSAQIQRTAGDVPVQCSRVVTSAAAVESAVCHVGRRLERRGGGARLKSPAVPVVQRGAFQFASAEPERGQTPCRPRLCVGQNERLYLSWPATLRSAFQHEGPSLPVKSSPIATVLADALVVIDSE